MAKPLTKHWIPEGKNLTYTKEKEKSKYIDKERYFPCLIPWY